MKVFSHSDRVQLKACFDSLDELLSFEACEGFLAAVISAPTLIMPSQWMGFILGDHAFESTKQAQDFSSLLMGFYNQISEDLSSRKLNLPDLSMGDDELHEWCWGYLEIVREDKTWVHDEGALELLTPFYAWSDDPERLEDDHGEPLSGASKKKGLQQARELLPQLVQAAYDYWLEQRRPPNSTQPGVQTEPNTSAKAQRIGRNEKCPCGSGAKYKHCCGA